MNKETIEILSKENENMKQLSKKNLKKTKTEQILAHSLHFLQTFWSNAWKRNKQQIDSLNHGNGNEEANHGELKKIFTHTLKNHQTYDMHQKPIYQCPNKWSEEIINWSRNLTNCQENSNSIQHLKTSTTIKFPKPQKWRHPTDPVKSYAQFNNRR